MARFRADESENYGGNGGGGFFSLKNDHDVGRVRFMYGGIEDVEGFSVHEVEVNGKKRYVNCLREYKDPVDKCPFCADGRNTFAKLIIPIYDEDDGNVKIWERGKKYFSKISGLCSRYPNLVEHVFEIERHGKSGDTQTTYEIFPVDGEKLGFNDLPEVPEILGGFILDKSAEDMEYYLEEGEFPPTDDDSEEDEKPVRRRNERTESRQSSRRTPATSRRRGSNEDVY